MTITCSLLIALVVSTGPASNDAGMATPVAAETRPTTPLADALKITPAASTETWMFDRTERRPAALPAMYAALGALNALDVYSTRRAVAAGAQEANPLMKKAAGSSATMMAVKALSTASTIYFTERAWKKNRKGAIIMMALVNGTMAAITARNLRNARQ